ncbi:hypothetical protein [Streptomyces sp. AM6-12]
MRSGSSPPRPSAAAPVSERLYETLPALAVVTAAAATGRIGAALAS